MDITGVILMTGIGLVVGFLVAVLIFSLRRESVSEQEPKEQLLSDSENKVHLWREGGEERLMVEMNGVSYRQGSRLEDEERQTVEKLVRELQTWLGAPTAAAGAVRPPQPELSSPPKEQAVQAQQETSLNPLKIFGNSLQPQKKTEGDEIDLSIVAQIDQILQTKLEGTHLDEKGIRLVEDPDQGLVIEFGLDKYPEIEAVPDEQVRHLIRLSVAEWERSTGG